MTDVLKGIDKSQIHQQMGEYFQQKRQRIETFINKTACTERIIEKPEGKILLLSNQKSQDIPDPIVTHLTDTFSRINKDGVFHNCYALAAMVVYTKSADGAISSQSGTFDFVGTEGHCVNYLNQPDGGVLAVDFTAGKYIDGKKGNFDILAIQATSIQDLSEKMHALYGGSWNKRTDEQNLATYKNSYPDTINSDFYNTW